MDFLLWALSEAAFALYLLSPTRIVRRIAYGEPLREPFQTRWKGTLSAVCDILVDITIFVLVMVTWDMWL